MTAQIIFIDDEAELTSRAIERQKRIDKLRHDLQKSLALEHLKRSKRHRAAGQHDAADRYLRHAETVLEQAS
mgnify:CR=1 FL=1